MTTKGEKMKPRIIGYEMYTGETPKGQPLFKVKVLVDMGDKHVSQTVFTSEDHDEAEDCLRTRKKWNAYYSQYEELQ